MKYRYDNREEYDLKDACKEYGFLVRPYFWDIPNGELLEIWNGVGAEGDWVNPFIPETAWGLNISLASLPHDIEFKFGKSHRDFHIANLNFLFNMNQIVRKHSDWGISKNARFLRTNKYYMAVESDAGYKAFYADKTIIEEII